MVNTLENISLEKTNGCLLKRKIKLSTRKIVKITTIIKK